ncbi:MAG TPA: 4Fe-4S binding protein [Syntrophomonas sp.]|nr:4Fe-4S binding protein [Syntrophomonas sp.]HRW11587.1 4Fe-4S binding protein [Syntrophomonas sp.]
MAKGRVYFHIDQCKACELCVAFCPQGILGLDEKVINILGYHPVSILRAEECTGCGICALMCPDLIIAVEKEK